MQLYTADICDEYREKVQVLEAGFNSYGGVKYAHGPIITLKLERNNAGLIEMLKEEGRGRIIVVDVDAEYYAVVGENLMKLAEKNGWSGIVVNGYVRDTHITKSIPVGLWAIGTCPRKSFENNPFKYGTDLNFAAVKFSDGDYLFADEDGIIIVDLEIVEKLNVS